MLDNYSSSYERILEKSWNFFMDGKRKHKLCTEICKTLNNLNTSFMKGSLEWRLCFRPVREQKLNLNIPRKKQVVFGIKSLQSLAPNIWNNMPYHMKSTECLNEFKDLLKKWKGSSCGSCSCSLPSCVCLIDI